ncbi:MAG: 3-isopropylmalate dehydratase small subunit [Deltaproteobacteria bacterium]|nr:3-isopropylmalate dehydratase small subunit [Deltaproteobacteria bacterium]
MKIEGKVWKFGDNIDTDVIIAARYLVTSDPKELAEHVMEDMAPEFSTKVQPGDIIVAGKNFGCGSSREHAPIAIKGAGIACIIAESFARIFFRNAFNTGLTIFESPEAARSIQEGNIVSIDADTGAITDKTKGSTFEAAPIPPFMKDLIDAGGLMPYVLKKRSGN